MPDARHGGRGARGTEEVPLPRMRGFYHALLAINASNGTTKSEYAGFWLWARPSAILRSQANTC
jgi:hypothetical protein